MKLLVFGKSGQVAQELAAHPGVTCMGREQVDLLHPDRVDDVIRGARVDAVINAAAYTAVDKAETDHVSARALNTEAPGRMARACARRNIPFLHISTDYVFDGSGSAAWTETDPTGPLGQYGKTKLAGEQAVLAAEGNHAILRTSWVFSRHGNNFVKTMLRLGEDRSQLNVVADQVGGPTPAKSIANTLVAMATTMSEQSGLGGIYHFSGAPNVSWADFARVIFDLANMKVEVTDIPSSDYPTPAPRPLNSRLDCTKIYQTFGIARPDWRDGLIDM